MNNYSTRLKSDGVPRLIQISVAPTSSRRILKRQMDTLGMIISYDYIIIILNIILPFFYKFNLHLINI